MQKSQGQMNVSQFDFDFCSMSGFEATETQ